MSKLKIPSENAPPFLKGTMDDLFEAMTFTQLHLLVNEGGMFLEQARKYRF